MEFPYRRGEEEHHHHHHHQYPHFHSREEEEEIRGYEARERQYPPVIASVYEPSPQYVPHGPAYAHTSHAPSPHAHVPSGPYGTHSSSGPYYPHPHEEAPPFEALPAEHAAPHSPELLQGQLIRIFCKKNQAFNLAVEHNTVIMKPADTQDEAQQWIKDGSYGMRVKDNYGYSAFSLVNKKTLMILKHAKEKGQQVLLTDYRPDIRDDDILWSESQDFGEGFRTVRCASDTLLNLTVFEGVKTVRNGSPLVLDTWHKGDHQLWKLFPL